MIANRLRVTVAVAALMLGITPALAQRDATPEQRIERLEKQVRQVQRQVFPKGQPADTAGFSDDPVATQSSFRTLDDRLNALERQLADILRQSEENGHRVTVLETDLAKVRSDQEARIVALEHGAPASGSVQTPVSGPATATTVPVPTAQPPKPEASSAPPPSKPEVTTATKPVSVPKPTASPAAGAVDANDPAEAAYDEGYQLWKAGKYDDAITSLRAFGSAYPKSHRASWANNLVGRALLDKGEPRAAAEALLANYRANPKGERAQDSLYYLGQSLMQLNQAGQACKAYAELEVVYGSQVRPELKRLLPAAKSDAHCS